MEITAIIPARGGSKGIPHKNLQEHNGRPLVLHAANLAATITDRVIISTDDPIIETVAQLHGYQVVQRPEHLATDDATIDELVAWWQRVQADNTWLLVIQPTVIGVGPDELAMMILTAGDTGTAMIQEVRHLLWGSPDDPPGTRDNRQRLSDLAYREIGVRLYPPGMSRLEHGFIVEGVHDVDTPADLAAARMETGRRDILIYVKGNETVGSGHVRRAVTLAEAMPWHNVTIEALDYEDEQMVQQLVPARYQGMWGGGQDLTITDVLDSRSPFPNPWIALEDQSPHTRAADLVINSLYGTNANGRTRTGAGWEILRPEFRWLPEPKFTDRGRVLVTFGGTDPARLTEWAAEALDPIDNLRILAPPGVAFNNLRRVRHDDWLTDPVMARELYEADVVVCSAGRTVFEAARAGTPAVVVAANPREARHSHLGVGNVFLGQAAAVTSHQLLHAVRRLLDNRALREVIGREGRGSVDGCGVERVVFEVERLLKGI